MNWDDLKYFLAVCREQSLSAAGRALGVKHTTVARRIHTLEQHLGTRLFDRSRDGYYMTQTAENLFEQALQLEEKIHQIDRRNRGLDNALAGKLKLTAADELAKRIIIPALSRFCQTFPKIDLQLMITKSMADLATMEADIAIRMTPSPPDYLVGRELMKIHHGIYGIPRVLGNLTQSCNVLLFDDEIKPPPWVNKYFKNAHVMMRMDDVGSMTTAVKSGLGIAKLPCFIGDTEPKLRRLDLDIGNSKWGVWMLNHIDLRTNARVRASKDYLEALFEQKKTLVLGELSRFF